MPRVRIKNKEYKLKDFSAWLIGQMAIRGMRQTDLGELLGMTQQMISQKLKKQSFTVAELMTIVHEFDVSADELEHLLKY